MFWTDHDYGIRHQTRKPSSVMGGGAWPRSTKRCAGSRMRTKLLGKGGMGGQLRVRRVLPALRSV